ncbi:MAG: hypothetical protein K1X83_12500 [Oligoflexia bacterium]|nr:hypothetical protein [Oligoflexia bacterium]
MLLNSLILADLALCAPTGFRIDAGPSDTLESGDSSTTTSSAPIMDLPVQNTGALGGRNEIAIDQVSSVSGAYEFSIPVELPPGVGDLSPSVAISYSSDGARDSLIGPGFSLAASGCIARQAPTFPNAQGKLIRNFGPPGFSDQDTFYLGADRLIPCDGSTSCPTGTFRTENNNFERVQARPAELPNGWLITKPDGTKIEYNEPIYAEEFANDYDHSMAFCQSRVVSGNNEILFTYAHPSLGVKVLQNIEYGGQAGASNHQWRIEFGWTDRADIYQGYRGGGLSRVTKKLQYVDVLVKATGKRLFRYWLDYEPTLPGPSATRKYRLLSVRQYGSDDSAVYPPYVFTYPNDIKGFGSNSQIPNGLTGANYFSYDHYVNLYDIQRELAKDWVLNDHTSAVFNDVNRDGFPDIVRHDSLGNGIWLNNQGRGFTYSAEWTNKLANVPSFGWQSNEWKGRTQASIQNVTYNAFGLYSNFVDGGARFGDFNGDGHPDILVASDNNCDNRSPLYWLGLWDQSLNGGTGGWAESAASDGLKSSFQSTGIRFNKFRDKSDCGKYFTRSAGVYVIDANGDGLSDIVHSGIYGWGTYLNKGNRFEYTASSPPPRDFVQYPDDASHNEYYDVDRGVRFGDVNGDGLPDIIVARHEHDDNTGGNASFHEVLVNTGHGWGVDSDLTSNLRTLAASTELYFTSLYRNYPLAGVGTIDYKNLARGTTLLDVNGDGKDDLVRAECFNMNCSTDFVALNTGKGWTLSDNPEWHLPVRLAFSNHNIWQNSGNVASYDFDTAARWTDLNNDGLLDVMESGSSFWNIPSGIHTYTNSSKFYRDLIETVRTPKGALATISYFQVNSANGSPDLSFAKTMVKSISVTNNGSGGSGAPPSTTVKDYYCYGAKYDALERRFLGCKVFSTRETLESDVLEEGFEAPSQYHFTTSWYLNSENDSCHRGALRRTVVSSKICDGPDGISGTRCIYDPANNFEPVDIESPEIDFYRISALRLRSVAMNSFDACPVGYYGPHFSPVRAAEQIVIDPAKQILRRGIKHTFQYSEFGSVSRRAEYAHASDAAPYRLVETTFASPNTSDWVVGKVCTTTLRDGSGRAIRGTAAYYDNNDTLCATPANGWLTKAETIGYPVYSQPETRITTRFIYNAVTGNPEQAIDGLGHISTTDWNSVYPGIFPASKTNAKGQTSYFGYDGYGNLTQITDVNNVVSQLRYDKLQRISESWIESGGDPSTHTSYQYHLGDPNTQYLAVTRTLDAARIVQDVTRFDGFGRKYLTISHGGAQSIAQSFSYNTRGLPDKVTLPYAANAPSEQRFRLDQPLTRMQYDPDGQRVRTTKPGGYQASSARYFYDEPDLFVQDITIDNTPQPIRRRIFTDLFGRMVRVDENPDSPNVQTTAFRYDVLNNQVDVCMADEGGDCEAPGISRIKRFYDGLSRLIALKDPDSSNCPDSNIDSISSGCPWRFSYDHNGNIKSAEDPLYALNTVTGTRIVYTYDLLNRVVEKSSTKNGVTYKSTFDHDLSNPACAGSDDFPIGRMTGASSYSLPSNGQTVSYCLSYDRLGRTKTKLATVTLPGAAPVSANVAYAYTQGGDVGTKTAAIGAQSDTVNFWYDDFGRPYSIVSSAVGGPVVSAITYNPTGQELIRYYRNSGEGISYQYRNGDYSAPAGDLRLSSMRALNSAAQFDLTYDYNPTGSVKSIYDAAAGRTETFEYDELNRLVRYLQGANEIERYDYDILGNRTSSLGGSASAQTFGLSYSYTPSGQASVLQKKPLSKSAILGIRADKAGTIGFEPAPSKELQLASTSLFYKYGQARSGQGGSHALKCLTSSAAADCSSALVSFSYDRNGNLESEINSSLGRTTTYTYNQENKIARISSGTTYTEYFYGPYGEKVAQSDNGNITYYLESGLELRGNNVAFIYRMNGSTAAILENGAIHFLYSDLTNSTRRVINGSTNQPERVLDYYPFGTAYNNSGTYTPRYTFAGEDSSNLGVSDLGERGYASSYGRFIQPDTVTPDISDPQSLNRYTYVRNNPVSGVDPTGNSDDNTIGQLITSFFINSFGHAVTGDFVVGTDRSDDKPISDKPVMTLPVTEVHSTRKRFELRIDKGFVNFVWLGIQLQKAFIENFRMTPFHDDIYDMMLIFTPVPYLNAAINTPGTFVSNVVESQADNYFGEESYEGVAIGTAASFFAPDPSDALLEVPLAERTVQRMRRISALGRIGEEAFSRMTGVALNKGPGMRSWIINGRKRIPDAVSATHIFEVKNKIRLSGKDVLQVKDSMEIAAKEGKRFALYLRPAETLAERLPQELMTLAQQGKIEVYFLTPLNSVGTWLH